MTKLKKIFAAVLAASLLAGFSASVASFASEPCYEANYFCFHRNGSV